MTGDGSRETDDNQSPSLYEDIEVMRSYTLLEITSISRYEVTIERRYADIRFTGGMAPPTKCPSSNAEYDPESDPESQLQCRYRTSRTRLIFGGATIFKEGDDSAGIATTPPRTITVPEVQERSTVKRIHQKRRLAAKSTRKEVMANAPTDESGSRMHNLQSRIRSRLSLGDPDSVSTIPRYTAAT